MPRDISHREQASMGSGGSTDASSLACLDRGIKRPVEKRCPLCNGLLALWD